MKLTIEPTDEILRVNDKPGRLWRGHDDAGVPVVALVHFVSPQTHDADVNARYERELKALPAAERQPPIAIDHRHII